MPFFRGVRSMRLKTISIVTFALIAAVLSQAAFAGGQTYVDKRRVVNAGVLLVTSAAGANQDPVGTAGPKDPFIFYIMGQRDDLKPQGWTFVNPIAGGNDLYSNQATYWRVDLRQTSLENLSKFDLLYLNCTQPIVFSMSDRDKLRRFVDGGGCLWVDCPIGVGMSFSTDPASGFFLPGVDFKGGAARNPMVLAKLHPLLTYPFWLSPQDIFAVSAGNRTINPGYKSSMSDLPNPTMLAPIVMDANGPTMAAIEYGSGRVLFTSGGIGDGIQSPVTGWTAPPAAIPSNANLKLATPANLRFAYNVVNWASCWTSPRKGLRRTGAATETISGRLTNKWNVFEAKAPGSSGPSGTESSPVFWKNVIFFSASSTGGSTLYAIDAVPEGDLDMDGNPDDGLPDASPGCDVIWKHDFPGITISSPTVASMLIPGSTGWEPNDFVLVTGSDGLVHIMPALPDAGGGRLDSNSPDLGSTLWTYPSNATPVCEPGNAGGNVVELLPPVVQNGWIYAVGQDGRLYAHSPVLASVTGNQVTKLPETPWVMSFVAPVAGTGINIKSGPTLGYIKSKATGATIQMLSFIGHPTGPGIVNDYMYSLPIYIASDRLRSTTTAGDYTYSYGAMPVASYPAPEVWAINPDGKPVSVKITDITKPGRVTITSTGTIGPNTRVYMSYALDYSTANTAGYMVPSREIVPNMSAAQPNPPQLDVGGTPALGNDDSYYMCVDWGTSMGGTGTGRSCVYSMSCDYSGSGQQLSSMLKWNYTLHGGGNMPDPNAAPGTAGGIVPISNPNPGGWGVWGIFAKHSPDIDGKPLEYVQVPDLDTYSSPAVTKDRVFVTARTKANGLPSQGYLICLKAKMSCQIKLNRSLYDPSNGDKISVRLWQPDVLTDCSLVASAAPPSTSTQHIPSEMIDYDSGTITITDFSRIRVTGKVDPYTGVTNTLSTSLPVWVFINGVPVSPQDVDLTGWNNLLWALPIPPHKDASNNIVPCSGVSSSPVVIGDYVYFTCDDGYLCSVAVDANPATLEKDGTANRDGFFKVLDACAKHANDPMPMRDAIGTGGATSSGASKTSIAGSGGVIAVPTANNGLFGYGSSLTLVTDNHRVMEIGSDGKISWACDTVLEPKKAHGVTVAGNPSAVIYGRDNTSLNKPLVAQKYSGSDYLVVDSGNDRVIRMDRGGQIAWSLTKFEDPNNVLRSGEAKTINSPSDARMWSEFENIGGNLYYMLHCLVADSGNFRVIDIVDRYNADAKGQILGPANPDKVTGLPIHELKWASSTSYRDKRFLFSSMQLVRRNVGGVLQDEIWTSVSNYTNVGGSQTSGAIIALKYRDGTAPYKWAYQDGSALSQLSTLTLDTGSGKQYITLAGPKSFTVLDPAGPHLLICDASAVYETKDGQTINWMMSPGSYAALRRTVSNVQGLTLEIPFAPQHVQMLPNGRLLIVNGFAGPTGYAQMPKFTGEVFEVDRSTNQIMWYAPDIVDDSGTFIQRLPNATNLDQPTCAQRLN